MAKTRSRREFLQVVAGAASAAPTVLRAQRAGTARAVAPADRIRVAIFGVGIRGQQDVRSALRVPGVELAAAADVYDGRLTLAKEVWGNRVFTTRDYREVLARPDVDAVIIATPDHWHAQMAIDAMNAGKDVYVEKPMVQHLDDGVKVIEAARRTGRILQVGSQHPSSIVYAKARELYRAGAIGELNLVEAWINRNSPRRFVGPEGVITIGDNAVTLARRPRAKEPGHTADTFAKATEEAFLKEYRTKFPDRAELRSGNEEVYAAPPRYNSTEDHFQTFFDAIRSRRPVVEDAVFGMRAAGPARRSRIDFRDAGRAGLAASAAAFRSGSAGASPARRCS